MKNLLFLVLLTMSLTACGGETQKNFAKNTNNANNENNVNNVNNTNNSNTNNANNSNNANNTNNVDSCGNGTIDPGESCDSGIASGEGACPTVCPNSPDACGTFQLTGSAADCSASCDFQPVACTDADGCCPAGCDASTDNDCTNVCGDGRVEGSEICDGNCPASCDDSIACTVDSFSGSAETCNLVCSYAPRTQCANGDGCCPNGCNASNDDDCTGSVCGDGTIEGMETCDGNCPTTCNDNNACTSDSLTGTPGQCDVVCSHTNISACQSGDGCCPAGCTSANDNDCACVPTTSCAAQGLTCGQINNGCQMESCGQCGTNQACENNQCLNTFGVGNPCTSDAQCPSNLCIDQAENGWPGGYCSRVCTSNAQCGPGQNCEYLGTDGQGICIETCNVAADCGRVGYGCGDRDFDNINACAPGSNGTGAVGSPCSDWTQCSGGVLASCFGSASEFVNGYCTRVCSTDSDCGSGSHCDTDNKCVKTCTSNSNCPADQRCYNADNDGPRECFIYASGTGAVGSACSSISQCGGGNFGRCFVDPVLPNGYCSILCGLGQGTCSTGSTCWDDNEICLDDCGTGDTCRAGYQCVDADGDFFTNDGCWF